MSINAKLWLIILVIFISIDLLMTGWLILHRFFNNKKTKELKNYKFLINPQEYSKKRKAHLTEEDYYKFRQVVQLDQTKDNELKELIDISKIEKKSLKKLYSPRKLVRLKAVASLGLLGTDTARKGLEKKILKEKDVSVKLYMANAITDIGNNESIPILAYSLINSHRFYRTKVNMLIADFGNEFNSFIPMIENSKHIEMRELIIDYASMYYSENARNFLVTMLQHREEDIQRITEYYNTGVKCCANCTHHTATNRAYYCTIHGQVKREYYCHKYQIMPVSIKAEENYTRLIYKACEVLATYYPKELDKEEYLNSKDVTIKNAAIKALSNRQMGDRTDKLITFLRDSDTARTAGNAISMIIETYPIVLSKISKAFREEKDLVVKKELAQILSGKIEYFILKLSKNDKKIATDIIREILMLGRNSEIIDFLNKNKDVDIENELIAIIIDLLKEDEKLQVELRKYLNERMLKKCGLLPIEENVIAPKIEKDKKLRRTLYITLGVCVFLPPLLYLFVFQEFLQKATFVEGFGTYIVQFNYYLGFYSITINLIYLFLLLLSFIQSKKLEKMWSIKNVSLLFKNKMLPSVSIIAPAYNEEKTIIESANSLLNLKYPDYELIIVNDGSKDNTLEILIKYFNLTRIDYLYEDRLKTKPIRGIYMNRSLPKLIVVDKMNGGKADSLNTGINISGKEYYCGIDADSLLEEDALLKLASLTLDENIETPALGGNILPINGCEVERGQIQKIEIPQNRLARFQTMEYIRSFMAGRLGWARLNSLLIISGAFGLFRKERVISVGGYLTSSGKYEKDTVGEDMELVVRITRLMREMGLKFKIRYSYHANCWTEVPEDLKTLKKQRYRWHKGLIDILNFHDVLIFNPRYGRTGMLAMPYFFFFEMVGPMFEFQGYIMVLLAFVFGLIYKELVLFLFVCTVLMGTLVSISSLLIAENNMKNFKTKDVLILIGYAIIENFGPRQLFSFWRVGAFLQMLTKPGGWDKAERKGFEKHEQGNKVK
ncbi:MAG: glycosyltransferase [Mobilitalea sp.]